MNNILEAIERRQSFKTCIILIIVISAGCSSTLLKFILDYGTDIYNTHNESTSSNKENLGFGLYFPILTIIVCLLWLERRIDFPSRMNYRIVRP